MTTTASREDSWVSIAQAAEKLGVHPRTLRRYIRDEKITVVRLSPQVVRIRPEDLRDFLDANVKITTGTGVCYVPYTPDAVQKRKPTPAKPSRPRL